MQTDLRSLEHLGAEKNADIHRPCDSRKDYSFGYMIVFKIIPKAGYGNTCLKSEHLIVEAETWWIQALCGGVSKNGPHMLIGIHSKTLSQ